LSNSPTLVTPALGAATGTSLALTGLATVGTTLGVTGVSTLTAGAVIQGLTVGLGAGAVATNTAVGVSALAANTTGLQLVALGQQALTANLGGSQNIGIGYRALFNNTSGLENVVLGTEALSVSTASNYNTVVGTYAGLSGMGSENVAIGASAMRSALGGASNVAIGRQALLVSTGNNNTAVGFQAGDSLLGGNGNQFFGYSSGSAVTTGAKNVILGSYTGSAAPISATGSNNIVLSDGDGVVRQAIDSSGRVFINQLSSIFGAQFEVTGTSGGQAVGIHGRASDGLANIVFGANGAGTEFARIQADNTSSLQFGAGSTGVEKMRLDSSGRLLINTTTGGVVSGGIRAVHDATEGTPTGIGDEVGWVQRNFNSAQSCALAIVSGTASTSNLYLGDKDSINIGSLAYSNSDNSMRFNTNAAERARIDSSGNLIVGNTTAYGIINGYTTQGGTKLSVLHGTAGSYPKVSGISFGATSTSITVSNDGGTTAFTGGAGIYANNTAASGNPTSLVFWVNASGSPAEAARIDSSGNLLVGVTTANANGGVLQLKSGITFPATAVAATDANTLDDYEEGTWTPNQGGNLTVVGTFSSTGNYVKVGKMVTVQVSLTATTSITISAGDAVMFTNLPFASSPQRNPGVAVNTLHSAGLFVNIASTTVYSCGTIVASATIFVSITYQTS